MSWASARPRALRALLLSVTAAAAAHAGGLERVRRQGELRWGADLQGGEPYVFRDPKDPAQLVGFEVEIARGLARRLGVRERMIQNAWQNLVPSLERGDYDVAMNGLEATPERRARLALTRPYLVFAEQLVVRRGERARSLAALAARHARVGTLASTLAHSILRATKGIEPALYEGVDEPYRDLQLGRLDAVLLESVIADRYGLTKPDLELADADVARGSYVIGVRKDEPDLRDALDQGLAQLEASGELPAIRRRWRLDATVPAVAAAPGPIAAPAEAAAPAATAGGAPAASLHPEAPEGEASALDEHARMDLGQLALFLRGAGYTLLVSLFAMALAVPLGLALALARRYGGPLARAAGGLYVELFRGTPVLLQLYLLYYGLAPLVHLSALAAAILGLGLNYAAYEAEVHRAALSAIPVGQTEAAAALGLSRAQVVRLVLLPQSLRTALPAMTNDLIALLKDSSLVSVITVVELTKQMTITAVDVRSWALPGLACAGLYFAMSYPLARLASWLEARLEAPAESEPGRALGEPIALGQGTP